MLSRVFALFVVLAGPAAAQTYLPQADLATAQARSQTQCAALGCDGVQTTYWWQVQPLSDGTAAVVVQPSGPFGPAALTAPEQSALVSPTVLGTKIPTVISLPAFQARFTALQLVAMNSSLDPAVSVPWAQAKGAATVNLNSPVIQEMLIAAANDGIIAGIGAVLVRTSVAVTP